MPVVTQTIYVLVLQRYTMFPLMKLPNELILHVINAVNPSDIEALVLCSKTINAFAKKAYLRHQLLKDAYSEIFLEDPPDEEPAAPEYSTFTLIEEILWDTEISYYPRRLSIGDHYALYPDEPFVPGEWAEEELAMNNSIISDELHKYIQTCPFLESQEKGEWCASLYKPGNLSISTALMFALLPNISSVSIHHWYQWPMGSDRIWKVVERIANVNRDIASRWKGKALTCLRKFNIEFEDDQFGVDNSINVFIPFAILPSMRCLYGVNIRGFRSLDSQSWPIDFLLGVSRVTKLHFIHSAVDAQIFSLFLAGFSALQDFRYRHQSDGANGTSYKPSIIIIALQANASACLQKIDMTADQTGLSVEEMTSQYAGSLQGFMVLEDIRVDQHIFVRSDLDLPTWKTKGEELEFKKRSFDRLVDVLPASAKSLTLTQWVPNGQDRLFDDMADLKGQYLPRLTRINYILDEEPVDASLAKAMEDIGILIDWVYE